MIRLIASCVAFLALSCGVLVACDCDGPKTAKEGLAGATAVFTGKVLKVVKMENFRLHVTFAVDQQWKGVKGKELTISTAGNGAACGYHFEPGKSYLVYCHAERNDPLLHTSICTRTEALAQAKDDLAALGPAVAP